jgi:hypothetical protein
MGALPFSDFLELLRAKGLGVGLHEHLAVGKLLTHWDSTRRDEFREAIAALVARHDGEVVAIRNLFDEFYPAETAAPRPVDPAQTALHQREYRAIRYLRGKGVWAAAVICLAFAFTIAVTYRYYTFPDIPPAPPTPLLSSAGPQPPLPPADDPEPRPIVLETLVQAAPDPPPADLPTPPSRINRPLIAALSTAVLVVSLLALWGARIRAAASQWTAEAWQAALASLPGPYHAPLVLKDLVTRLPRRDVEDAATLLARAFSGVGRGKELDVQRSLKETLRTGMRPQLVFRLKRVQQTVLVIQDVSQMMHAHAGRVESFIIDLKRQGIAIERWYFDGDISVVTNRRNGPPIPLDVLAKRREDWPLMILSSGLGVAATLTLRNRTWMSAFRTFTRRVWLSPIRDPELWPAAVRRLPIGVLPMTRAGILQAATILAQGEYSSPGMLSRARETASPVTIADVEKLKQLASVVPYPTLPELELLRQRFAPDVPERAVLHVANDIGAYEGAPIRMSDGDIRDHLHRLRKASPALEVELRRYLLKVLADSEPVPGSAAHLRWEISSALHRVQIAELTGSDARPAMAALAGLARGPLWRELRDAIEKLPPSPQQPEIRKAAGMQGRPDEPPAFQDRTGHLHVESFHWRMPRWQDAAVAAAVTLVVAAIGSFSSAFRLQASHALDAYVLEYRPSAAASDAGELRIFMREQGSSAPRTVRLYRDSVPQDATVALDPQGEAIVPLPSGGEPHVYQVRADLSGGAFALSNTLWAPSALVIIDAQPWARVTLRSTDGRVPEMTQVTPAALRLPEGTYDLSFENGGVTAPLTRQIQVSSTGQRTFRFDMPGFDPSQLLNQLGVTGAPPPTRQYRQ